MGTIGYAQVVEEFGERTYSLFCDCLFKIFILAHKFFSSGILKDSGEVNRATLGGIVFSNKVSW